ncbi:MAG: hypothetical protein AABX38_03820 [Candidatus Micrarchaeota archaeon]
MVENESLLKPLNPSMMSIILFVLFLAIHIVGTYSADGLSKFPFSKELKFSPPAILEMIFSFFWKIIALPLLLCSELINSIFNVIFGIGVFNFLNSVFVFFVYVIYYYLFSCVLSTAVKK